MKSVLLQHRVKQKHLRLRRFAVRFGIFFVLLSPRFQLGPITLSGNATVPSEEITTAAGAFFGERVAWFFSRGNMLNRTAKRRKRRCFCFTLCCNNTDF